MAIPFAMPSSEEDTNHYNPVYLEQLLCDLNNIRHQIEILLLVHRFQRATAPSTTMSPRVCTSPRHTSSCVATAAGATSMPDLVNNLPATTTATFPRMEPPPTTMRHPRRHRINSDSSCCDHTKYISLMDDGRDEDDDAFHGDAGGGGGPWSHHQVGVKKMSKKWMFVDACIASKPTTNTNTHPSRLPSSTPSSHTTSTSPSDDEDVLDDDSDEEPPCSRILSKLMPTSKSSRSLWTAVICAVGCWRIFRAR